MNVMNLNDLDCSVALDHKAMGELKGGDCRHLRGLATHYLGWSPYSLVSTQYQGLVFHDGVLSRKMAETWKRTRIEIEYSYWDVYRNL